MMKYKCRKCEKEFDVLAWITYRPTVHVPPTQYQPFANPVYHRTYPYGTGIPSSFTMVVSNQEVTLPCCPFCYSQSIEENKDE